MRVDSLVKHFTRKDNTDVVALDRVSIDFDPQQTTVIVGPSGSGKSTLLRTLNLLEFADSGSLEIGEHRVEFGGKIAAATKRDIRRHSAMIFQDFQLFSHLRVLANVTLGPIKALGLTREVAENRARKLLDLVGLAGREDAFPFQLSGGQKQRVAIARAMAMEPEFLLCDEPTSALDPELAVEVRQTLAEVARGRTALIMVTHDLVFAHNIADRIIFMQNGAVQFDGPTAEFFTTTNERIVQFRQIFDA